MGVVSLPGKTAVPGQRLVVGFRTRARGTHPKPLDQVSRARLLWYPMTEARMLGAINIERSAPHLGRALSGHMTELPPSCTKLDKLHLGRWSRSPDRRGMPLEAASWRYSSLPPHRNGRWRPPAHRSISACRWSGSREFKGARTLQPTEHQLHRQHPQLWLRKTGHPGLSTAQSHPFGQLNQEEWEHRFERDAQPQAAPTHSLGDAVTVALDIDRGPWPGI